MNFVNISTSYFTAFFSVPDNTSLEEETFSSVYKEKIGYLIAVSWTLSRLLRYSKLGMLNAYYTHYSYFWLSCYGLFVDATFFNDTYSGWVQFPIEEAFTFVRDGKLIPQTYGIDINSEAWIRGDCRQATPVFILQTIIDYLHHNFYSLIHKLSTNTQIPMTAVGIPFDGLLLLVSSKEPARTQLNTKGEYI